ncbi:hypothetical protein [Cohnella soli]|uniref:7-cyano-7-deazaguanine synthase n=1 Tax=Cohnella soli TaxID=425005 RepID=A0ABW0HXM7_9BACL
MPKKENAIYVNDVVARGNTVRYAVNYGSEAEKYFSGEPFFVEYDRDVSSVPKGLLVIPLLANLCPVAWVAGVDVYVDELDKGFYESLLLAQRSFGSMYPRLKFAGTLHVRRITETSDALDSIDGPDGKTGRSAAFFSGGVDSMGTFIRRREEKPFSVTVWGADISFGQSSVWEKVKRANGQFALENGVDQLFIKANLHGFLNEKLIAFTFGRFTHGWWPGIQHGIGMVGLLAPLSWVLGIRRLYVPSALPPKLARSFPDGSNTLIGNHIRWSGTTVQLDGEQLTRQDKVSLIADFMRSSEQPVRLRVCWMNEDYGNCGRCEKCLRTISALLAEGVDPATAGFNADKATLEHLRRMLPVWLPSSVLTVEYWNEIRVRSIENDEKLPAWAREFFDWFQHLDVPAFVRRRSLIWKLVDIVPHPLFLFLKRLGMNRQFKTERG